MSDLKLSDGREVEIDLYQISMKEYRDWFFDPQVEDKDVDNFIEKVTGIKNASSLPQPDYRLIVNKVYEKSIRPVSDPNSSSESSSTTKKATKNQSD